MNLQQKIDLKYEKRKRSKSGMWHKVKIVPRCKKCNCTKVQRLFEYAGMAYKEWVCDCGERHQ